MTKSTTCATANVNKHGPVARRQPILIFSPHPLLLAKERELIHVEFLSNETILAYLRRTGLLERMGRAPFVLTVYGRRLPRTLWAHCRPKPGTPINLIALTRGGDGNGKKNPIATVAMMALSMYTAGMAPVVGAAIMVTGGLIVPAIYPPPCPRKVGAAA